MSRIAVSLASCLFMLLFAVVGYGQVHVEAQGGPCWIFSESRSEGSPVETGVQSGLAIESCIGDKTTASIQVRDYQGNLSGTVGIGRHLETRISAVGLGVAHYFRSISDGSAGGLVLKYGVFLQRAVSRGVMDSGYSSDTTYPVYQFGKTSSAFSLAIGYEGLLMDHKSSATVIEFGLTYLSISSGGIGGALSCGVGIKHRFGFE